MNELSDFPIKVTPFVKIIGVGDGVKSTLDAIKRNIPEIAQITSYNNDTPKDNDRLVIFVSDSENEKLAQLISKYKREDNLVIVFSTYGYEVDPKGMDSMMITSVEQMPGLIQELLWVIIHQGPIMLAYQDLKSIMEDSQRFVVLTAKASGQNRIEQCLKQMNIYDLAYSNYLVAIYMNPNEDMKVTELSCLSEWAGKFGEEVYIIWGVLYDESLSVGDIKMTVIDTE